MTSEVKPPMPDGFESGVLDGKYGHECPLCGGVLLRRAAFKRVDGAVEHAYWINPCGVDHGEYGRLVYEQLNREYVADMKRMHRDVWSRLFLRKPK